MFEPTVSDKIQHGQSEQNRTNEDQSQISIGVMMCVRNRFDNNDHLTDKERNETQIKRKIILLVQIELMKQIFQRIQSSQSRIADLFIKFEKFTKKECRHQSHRNHQNFDVKSESKWQRKQPNSDQNKRHQNYR